MKILEARIAKVLQKHQKSITFFTIDDMGLHHVEIPYKSNGKLMMLRVPFRPKSDFGALADANLPECRNGTKIKFENLLIFLICFMGWAVKFFK